MTTTDLPQVATIRKIIWNTQPTQAKMALTDIYLKAARVSETIAVKCPSDTTTVYGPNGSDATIETIDGHEALILQVRTAKRKGKERIIALPFETEPFAKPLYDYYKSFGDDPVFPFTRQWLWVKAKELFEGYTYPIMAYKVKYNVFPLEPERGEIIEVPAHIKRFTLHAIRHLRATELVRFYHFKAEDLAAYCGWRLTTVTKATSVMERYVDLSAYLDYFPKLLKQR